MNASASLELATLARLADAGRDGAEDTALSSAASLDRFLASVERRAFRIAQMALRDRDDALDVVQGAMLRLARNYAQRPSEEWRPLFYRHPLQRHPRRAAPAHRPFADLRPLPGAARDDDEDAVDPYERVPDPGPDPSRQAMTDEAMQRLEAALQRLPPRQQQAFALRCLEGMDVAEAAAAMGCAEGSVKTHYFRALQALRAQLSEVW